MISVVVKIKPVCSSLRSAPELQVAVVSGRILLFYFYYYYFLGFFIVLR